MELQHLRRGTRAGKGFWECSWSRAQLPLLQGVFTSAPSHPGAPGQSGRRVGALFPVGIPYSLEPQGCLNTCCASYSHDTAVTTKPLPVPSAVRLLSVPIPAHCPVCPRAVSPPRWPRTGAGAPWPGTLVPAKGAFSPVSQDSAQSTPISLAGKH